MFVAEIGAAGQEAIMKSKVVVIGLGALGSTIANILARAGVGTLGLVDRDFVDWSNLQRQGLYDEEDVKNSLPKAVAAEKNLARINSDIRYEAVVADVNPGNIEKILSGASIVLDGLDNFYTRALINEACVKMGIPWVQGARVSTYGNVAAFIPGETACYNCFYPGVADLASPETCDTVGVLGPLAFLSAAWQASEAIKILSGKKEDAFRGMIFVELWENNVKFLPLKRSPECTVCGKREFALLSQPSQLMVSSLCGRNAVQIIPAASKTRIPPRA